MKSAVVEPIYGNLPDNWRMVSLAELIDADFAHLQTGPFGTMLHASAYRSTGTPVVAVLNIGENRLKHEDIPRVDEETARRLDKYRLKQNDILFGRKGAVDRRALIRANENDWLQGSDCIRLRFYEETILPQFVSYVLGSNAYRQWIIRHAHGATMPSLNQEILRLMPLPLPPIDEQRAIAAILGALDDKIELNRRMNRTLEEMARALFKSWFVDFDPVRAKAEGRDPGLPSHLADLFPARLQDSELVDVPEGWRVGGLGEDFDLTMGQSPPGETYNESGNGLPFFQGRADFGFRFPSNRVYCTAPTRFANPSDTLVSVRAPVGDINMATERCAIGRGVAAIRHKSGSRSYTFYAMQFLESDFARFEGEGTVFGSINKSDFRLLSCGIPLRSVVERFEELAYPLDQRIETNENESRTLVTTRDTLLPKLMSGEVRVREAETLIMEQV